MSRAKDIRSAEKGEDMPVDKGTSTVEWIAAACGAALFLAMIGYMTYAGIHEVDGAPSIELATVPPIAQGDRFLVGFTATNVGQATATSLTVRATLDEGEREVESQDVTIDYLPMRSSRAGGFFFTRDPKNYRLTVIATSYLDP